MTKPEKNKPKQFVLDTNVLIHDPSSLYMFDEHDIVIPLTVLEELDHIKDSQKSNHLQVGREARLAIQHIDKVVNGHDPDELRTGIPIGKGLGQLRIVMEQDLPSTHFGLDITVPDNRIIASALYLMQNKQNVRTVLVTKDINMRLKAKAAGVKYVEDYRTDQVLSDIDYLSPGYMDVNDDWLSEVDTCTQEGRRNTVVVPKSSLPANVKQNLYPNYAFIQTDVVWFVRDVDNDKVTLESEKLSSLMKTSAFGITPRNHEQALAIKAMLSDDIDIVFLTGQAGTGKTLLALSVALELTVEKGRFDKIIVTRSVTDMDEGIGFLPGTEEEKMMPWLGAISDSLEVLAKGMGGGGEGKLNGKDAWGATFAMMQQKANLQFKSLNFMRGRSISNAFLILDECQNLSAHQMRSIITRVGPGTKIVCLGNLQQIDARYLTALTSGLTASVEKFKVFKRGATVMLKGGVRSPVATFAEDNF